MALLYHSPVWAQVLRPYTADSTEYYAQWLDNASCGVIRFPRCWNKPPVCCSASAPQRCMQAPDVYVLGEACRRLLGVIGLSLRCPSLLGLQGLRLLHFSTSLHSYSNQVFLWRCNTCSEMIGLTLIGSIRVGLITRFLTTWLRGGHFFILFY